MKQSSRKRDAEETVVICAAKEYTAPGGRVVKLQQEIDDAVAGTELVQRRATQTVSRNDRPAALSVTNETTTSALKRLVQSGATDVACLNFASAKNPGGGFLGGAEAQEESLARSSALYPCLLAAREFYGQNRAHRSTLYLDLAIWSPEVPFIRGDDGALLEEPYLASVITCPAPNAGAIEQNEPDRVADIEPALRRRAEHVLNVAASRGVRHLVLGAWGCGVFRNDPRLVAEVFAELLRPPGLFSVAFEQVIFAVFDRSKEGATFRAFAETFGFAEVDQAQ